MDAAALPASARGGAPLGVSSHSSPETHPEVSRGAALPVPAPQPPKPTPPVSTPPAAAATISSATWAAVCPALAALGSVEEFASTLGSGDALPPRLVVHPQGFRILSHASALERNMRGYFRLPQPPNAATREERQRLRRTLQRIEEEEAQRKARVTGNLDGVVLDGFLMLSACGADEPEEVSAVALQSSQLSSSVAEDLQYFTHLTSLDLSDNRLRLGHVLSLPRVEEVHLVCNSIASLAEVPQCGGGSLDTITTLDLAYNRIPAHHLSYLGAFTALQQLDLSHNGLRTLPRDLSSLAHLTHIALEANELSAPDVFLALGTMPALVEMNLAKNRLSAVPLLHTGADGSRHRLFPSLQVVSLAANRFGDVEALRPLAALHQTLRRVAVGGNPLMARRHPPQDVELQRVLDEAVVDAYYVALLPPQEGGVGPDEMADTWHRQTWVRYIPQRTHDPDADDPDAPPAAAYSSRVTAAPASPHGADDGDTPPPLPTVEEYLERYRILVQTSSAAPAVLPKQPRRFFYSSAFRTSSHGTIDALPLVTLPPYGEFMDVYRVLGRRRPAPPGGSRGHGTGVSRRAARAAAHSVPPPASARPSTLPHLPTPPPAEGPTPSGLGSEDDTGEADTAHDGDGVFLTELVSGAPQRPNRDAPKDRRVTAVPPPPRTLPAEHASRLQEPVAASPALTTTDALPPPRLPRSVVSPATTNVHTAMSELRALLRKPLPSLPYDVAGGKPPAG
ncbi:Leucine Rich repeat/Leucine rich repeat/Leucine Rich Repeat [Novymonas esmeraldas]|uniref:Leucine Rich repeat/Leucine rich repeat/Leucine Rich Repeat n=1 Tax=Novymonas esmeraldas TaxID=1808958 RepID=A0AAW0F333_9TRYP